MTSSNVSEEIKHQTIDIINFIAQEAYRLALIKQYPDYVSRIFNLNKSVTDAIHKVLGKKNDITPPIEKIILFTVSHIATKSPVNHFRQELKTLIDEWWDPYGDHENNENDIDLRQELLIVLDELYSENQDLRCDIKNKYPVAMLAIEFNRDHLAGYYHDALDYFYNRKYLLIRHKNEITFTHPPYRIFRPIVEHAPYRVKYKKETVNVPASALSRKKGDIIINDDIPNLADSYFVINNYRHREHVDITTELIFQIDISNPLSNNKLARLLSYLRSDISNAQEVNRINRMCLAQTENKLIEIFDTPRLQTDDYFTLSELHKAEIEDLNSEANAKDLLCALILISTHFIKLTKKNNETTISWGGNTKECNLYSSMELLSSELLKKHGRRQCPPHGTEHIKGVDYSGFSVAMIERGYKKLNKLINQHLDEFQRGRIQFNKKLNKTQREKLHNAITISLDQLPGRTHECLVFERYG